MIGTFLPPKMLLGVIRKQIESELNDQRKIHAPKDPPIIISRYTAEIDLIEKQIYFHVVKKKLPFYDGKRFIATIEDQIKSRFNLNDVQLHKIVVEYSPDEIKAAVMYEEKGIKKQQTKIIK